MSLFDVATPEGAEHVAWLDREADRLLEWALGAERADGGFGWRADDGTLDAAAGRPLWIGCRMIHCVALGALRGHEGCAEAVDRGLEALRTAYRDDVHGGWFADADARGQGRKEAYGHAFVVLAASSALVAGRPGARELLDEALAVVLEHFWDDELRMPYESYDVAWGDREEYRGGNASMHLVEVFLAASDATGDPQWRQRATDVCVRMMTAARENSWRIPEHFDTTWQPLPDYNIDQPRHPFRPYGATPGHAFEWARLLLTLRAAHPAAPAWLDDAAVGLVETARADAWDVERGGFVYTTDQDGVPVVRERFHWVACEAIGAAWALHRATGDARWEQWYAEVWDFAVEHFADLDGVGGWRHEVSPANEPVALTWTGRPDVYHALQIALLPPLPLAPGLAVAVRDRAR